MVTIRITLSNLDLRSAREQMEKSLLKDVLVEANGNVKKASELLGVSRVGMYYMMDKYNVLHTKRGENRINSEYLADLRSARRNSVVSMLNQSEEVLDNRPLKPGHILKHIEHTFPE